MLSKVILNIKNFKKDKIYYIVLAFILFAGIFLRLKVFLSGYTLWLDECSLSLSIIQRGIFGFFKPLEHTQSAPPLFMMATKLITNIFSINEISLRIIPFFASILSLPVFYFLSKKFLDKKYSILIAAILFCINYYLIYYSVEFKQYSSDVLIFITLFLFFLRLNLKKCGYKKAFLYGLFAFICFLFSVPSIFVTGGFLLYNFIKIKENLKQLMVFLAPFIICMPVYYLFVLYPSKLQMINTYGNLWQSGFITLNPLSLVIILKENISYFFNQDKFTLFGAILLITGLICIFKKANFKQQNGLNPSLFLILTLACIILASFFKIYPIKQRVALYILPFFLILIIKPLDFISFKCNFKNIIKNVLIIFLFIFFISSYNFQYFKNIYKNIELKKGYGDKLMLIIKQGYKNNDIVVYNDASSPIYTYNSTRYNFKTDKFIMINIAEYSEEYYYSLLDSLPKNNTYWFYYPYYYYKQPVIYIIERWAKNKNILYSRKIGNSYLLHVKL